MTSRSISRLLHFVAIVLTLALGLEAKAAVGFELRTPLGFGYARPTALNESQPEIIRVRDISLFGADGIVTWDSWGVGLRFESVSSIKYDGGNYLEVAARCFDLLFRKTWEYRGANVGPFATIGVFHNSAINLRRNEGPYDQYVPDYTRSFAVGGEMQWLFQGVFLVGFETGYQWLVLGPAGRADGTRLLDATGSEFTTDMSGPHAKLLLGLSF